MRIGIVTSSYPRFAGDPSGPFVAEHAAWLAREGHDVEVVAAGAPGELDDGPGGAVSVVRVPAAGDLFYAGGAPEALDRSRWTWIHAARFTASLTRYVVRRARHWDAIIAHWLVPGALAACAARRPTIAIAHSGDVHLLARTRLARPMARLLLARGIRTVFVSESVQQRFRDALPAALGARVDHSASVCSMGIDVERFRRAALDENRRAERANATSASPATVVFLGRLVPVKGVETLIAAARLLRSDTRVVIAGDGSEAGMLARLSRNIDSVTMLGEVRGARRDALLAHADVAVLPSVHVSGNRTEGMPVVALEAMAARTPLIASRVGGLAELPPAVVTHVPERDPRSLAAAIDELLADRTVYARQQAAAEAFVAARDWSVVGPKILSLLS